MEITLTEQEAQTLKETLGAITLNDVSKTQAIIIANIIEKLNND